MALGYLQLQLNGQRFTCISHLGRAEATLEHPNSRVKEPVIGQKPNTDIEPITSRLLLRLTGHTTPKA